MRCDPKYLRKPNYADPEDAALCLKRAGFSLLGGRDGNEVYERGEWRISRLEPGSDLWMCHEGSVRWYVGRLMTALITADGGNASAGEDEMLSEHWPPV